MLLYFLGWLTGLVIGSFFLVQPLIIIFFSIPFTLKLRKMDAVAVDDPIMKRDLLSLIVQVIIFTVTYIFIHLNNNLFIGFLVGLGFIFLFGIGKIFKNTSNVADYMENNFRFIHPEFMKQYLEDYVSKMPDSKEKTNHIQSLINKSETAI